MMSSSAIVGEVRHYIVRNTIAMLGTSLYVIIDTLFISIAAGPLGLTTLNLSLPMFNMFNATGLLMGVGGATLFALNKIVHPEKVASLYSDLMIFAFILGIVVAGLINVFPVAVVNFLGANAATRSLAITYIRIASWAGPFVMCNYISINFIRNDDNPTLTMMATVVQTVCVLLIDWLLIFVCDLKMPGAALAFISSPVVSLLVLSRHRHFANRHLKFFWHIPDLHLVVRSMKLGFASALNELSTGVSIYAFNHVLLQLANNYAVSAYGVISNIVLVVMSIANGIALGVQPISSREYGLDHNRNVMTAFKVGFVTTLVVAVVEFIVLITFKVPIINIFNSSHSSQLLRYAVVGLPIYFTSIFFTALNILFILFLTSLGHFRGAFTLSLLRGYIVLLPMIFLMAYLAGIRGVWAAVPVSEFLVCLFGSVVIGQQLHQLARRES